MFPDLYHSVTINESKEKFRIDFCCLSAMKNIVAPITSSNFTTFEEYLYLLLLINQC